MIKDKCIECKCKESNKKHERQKPFEHLFRLMFDRSKKEDARNGKLIKEIYD